MSKKFIYVDASGDYTEATGYETSEFINVSTGAPDAGKPIVLDSTGKIDASMIDQGDIDHGSIGGLGDDDHTQYILVDGTRAFTGSQSMGSFNLTSVADPTTSTINSASDDAVPMSFLASTANAEGAAVIGIEDASAYYSGNNLEAALNELESQIGGATSSTYNFSENNVLTDNDPLYSALNKLDLKWGDLASQANGEGASLVGIQDFAGYYNSTDVEGALAEVYALASVSTGETAIVGTGGVTKGDLLYFSAANTVNAMPITAGHVCVGIALETKLATETVRYARWDELVAGVLVGATFNTKYYWDGSALTSTIPSTSGQYVWQAGVAKNATDLLATVEFVKKNL